MGTNPGYVPRFIQKAMVSSAKPKSPMGKKADEIFYRALASPIKPTVVKKYVPKTSAKKKVNTGRPKTAAKHRPKSPP